MKEIDFDQSTMTRATSVDIFRIYRQLWGIELPKENTMPYGYNSLNDFKLDLQEIGMCPICSVRLTHGCEHSQTQESQEWLAAVIVAEQELANEKYNFAHPITEAQQIERAIDATLHAEDLGTRMIISGGEVLELGAQTGSCEDIF